MIYQHSPFRVTLMVNIKLKRVLVQRDSKYLVKIVGEPADNAVWVASSALNAKAKREN